jgi:hypothetical protein
MNDKAVDFLHDAESEAHQRLLDAKQALALVSTLRAFLKMPDIDIAEWASALGIKASETPVQKEKRTSMTELSRKIREQSNRDPILIGRCIEYVRQYDNSDGLTPVDVADGLSVKEGTISPIMCEIRNAGLFFSPKPNFFSCDKEKIKELHITHFHARKVRE